MSEVEQTPPEPDKSVSLTNEKKLSDERAFINTVTDSRMANMKCLNCGTVPHPYELIGISDVFYGIDGGTHICYACHDKLRFDGGTITTDGCNAGEEDACDWVQYVSDVNFRGDCVYRNRCSYCQTIYYDLTVRVIDPELGRYSLLMFAKNSSDKSGVDLAKATMQDDYSTFITSWDEARKAYMPDVNNPSYKIEEGSPTARWKNIAEGNLGLPIDEPHYGSGGSVEYYELIGDGISMGGIPYTPEGYVKGKQDFDESTVCKDGLAEACGRFYDKYGVTPKIRKHIFMPFSSAEKSAWNLDDYNNLDEMLKQEYEDFNNPERQGNLPPFPSRSTLKEHGLRPSPTEKAGGRAIGTTGKGNDGHLWEVVANINGVRRWKKCVAPSQEHGAEQRINQDRLFLASSVIS